MTGAPKGYLTRISSGIQNSIFVLFCFHWAGGGGGGGGERGVNMISATLSVPDLSLPELEGVQALFPKLGLGSI